MVGPAENLFEIVRNEFVSRTSSINRRRQKINAAMFAILVVINAPCTTFAPLPCFEFHLHHHPSFPRRKRARALFGKRLRGL